MKTLPYFDNRRALQQEVIARRRQGDSWRDIKRALSTDDGNCYYIYYLKGITPRSVGGYAPDGFDPDGGAMMALASQREAHANVLVDGDIPVVEDGADW